MVRSGGWVRRRGESDPQVGGVPGTRLGGVSLCWSESQPYDADQKIVYGRTRDFRTVVRDPRGYAHWQMGDGLVSPWREGERLYLFAGRFVHVLDLPVREHPNDSQPSHEGEP